MKNRSDAVEEVKRVIEHAPQKNNEILRTHQAYYKNLVDKGVARKESYSLKSATALI